MEKIKVFVNIMAIIIIIIMVWGIVSNRTWFLFAGFLYMTTSAIEFFFVEEARNRSKIKSIYFGFVLLAIAIASLVLFIDFYFNRAPI